MSPAAKRVLWSRFSNCNLGYELDKLFNALAKSAFRSRFHLRDKDLAYLQSKGLALILEHGRDFIRRRLADALPKNDGKQTPFRGHPIFVAQHATACCCRSCLEKWHGIAQGQALTVEQQEYVLEVLQRWLARELCRAKAT